MKTPYNTSSSRRKFLAFFVSLGMLGSMTPAKVHAFAGHAGAGAPPSAQQPLKKYNVTVRRFNPAQGPNSGEQFVLPVDSPDPEHAISAAMSNAVAFTTKFSGGSALPVAFICKGIAERK